MPTEIGQYAKSVSVLNRGAQPLLKIAKSKNNVSSLNREVQKSDLCKQVRPRRNYFENGQIMVMRPKSTRYLVREHRSQTKQLKYCCFKKFEMCKLREFVRSGWVANSLFRAHCAQRGDRAREAKYFCLGDKQSSELEEVSDSSVSCVSLRSEADASVSGVSILIFRVCTAAASSRSTTPPPLT